MDDGSISVFWEKWMHCKNATILEVQNTYWWLKKIKLEESKNFTLKNIRFVFEEDNFMDSYYKSYTLPIVYHKNYLLSINNDKE